ncbi:hypothetical protein BKA69DRAFT_1092725 [Paraphysoderma sedebokerense]|nr:hypothetical protein BKA69DRAFT_1092725 [Paraphysoderma sedebokerense]
MAKSFQDPSVGASINGWNDPKPGLFAVTKSSSVQSLTNVGITSKLKEIIEKCKEGTVSQPPKHKMVVDCEKRLAELFTKLGDGAVPELLMSHLSELMNGAITYILFS